MNTTKFVLIALAALFALSQATCVDQVCRCAANAREVGSYAGGCYTCYCEATSAATSAAPTTAAPTTARATTAAATTARATTAAPTTARATTPASSGSCGTVRQCKCQAGAVVMWDIDSNGCPSCYCAAAGSAATGADAAASDSSSSGSASSSFVPVVVALACICALMIAVIAVYRFKANHGRFPWGAQAAEETPSDVETSI
eukprot:m.161282 g.161282  ORF g.161282 m.161282 type:complete len:202 (-) comp15193_c12_seq5:34-639(-)